MRREGLGHMHLRNFTETIWQDLCFGGRRLAKSPGFTLTVILTLGLGIGMNSAIFSVVRGILLREPPVKRPERILVVTTENLRKGLDRFPASPREFSALRQGSSVFEQLAAASYDDLPLTGEGEPQLVTVGRVTPNYFDLLGLSTIVGRSFLASVDVSRQQFDAVISYDLWRDRWDADSGFIGQTLVLGERNYTVVGVMASNVKYAMAPCTVWTAEGFIQQALRPKESKDRNLTVLARLSDGVSRQEAEAETTTIFQRLARDDRDNSFDEIWVPRLIGLREFLVGPSVRRVLVLLMFVVGLVLLTACANCAGVSLARSTARQNEFAIRVALGAERRQLIQHLLVESALLALFSGGLGVLVALWGVMFLRARLHFSPWAAWLAGKIEVDGMVLFFAFFISCLTVLLFGLMPALRSSQPDPTLLKGSRTASPLGRSRIRAGIVIGEVAIAMVLTVSTVASIQLIITEMRPQLGFDPQRVLTLSVALSGSRYNSPSQQVSFFKRAIEGVQTLPGVQFAGATQELPESFPSRVGLEIEGHASSNPLVAKYIVSPDYFSVMRIAILKGRAFSVRDDADAPAVAIVNRTFANRFFPNVDPVGARVRTYVEGTLPDSREIVGIVADVIDYVGQNQSVPQIYVPFF